MSERSVWKNPPRGFRLMTWDPIAVAACGAAVWLAWPYLGEWSLVAPYVLGTFFLYCNVFRVRRSFELIWATLFLVNAVVWLTLSPPSLPGVLLPPAALTILLIRAEIRSPRYHGILSDRVT